MQEDIAASNNGPAGFNRAWARVMTAGHLTLELMTPLARTRDAPADFALETALAARADALGIAALWTRDVPLIVPQGSAREAAVLDDPFVWLAALAVAAPNVAIGTAAAVLPLRHPLAHMLLNLQGARPIAEQLEELGAEVIPRLAAMALA
jgi:hypothetical protein